MWLRAFSLGLAGIGGIACDPRVADPVSDDREVVPGDSEPPVDVLDTDVSPPDPDTDVEPAPALPPARWGRGFVDVSGALLGDQGLVADEGDPVAMRGASATSAQWVDLDHDGVEEVVVWDSSVPLEDQRQGFLAYRWQDGVLVAAPERLAGLGEGGNRWVTAFLDLDRDGHLDVVGGGPSHLVRWGAAEGWGPWEAAEGGAFVWGTALGVADLDEDGWLDFLTGGACAGPLEVLMRTGPRSWTLRPDLVAGPVFPGRTFGLLPGHTTHGEPFIVAVTDSIACNNLIEPHPLFYRMRGRAQDGAPIFEAHDGTDHDAWWRLEPETYMFPLSMLAPMGAALGDLDGDAHADLVVSLGDPPQAVLGGRGDGTFEDVGLSRALIAYPNALGGRSTPWAVGLVDLDRDGRNDVLMPHGDDWTSFTALDGGLHRVGAWWNDGAGRFVDVGLDVGLGMLGNWHGLAMADADADGDADLIVGGFGWTPHVLRNEIELGRGFSLHLEGTTRNALAIGAQVEVEGDGLPLQRATVSASGNFEGWTGTTLFFAAGGAGVAREVRIRWPSGWTQVLTDVPADRAHRLVEPPTVTLGEAGRHAPADGAAVVPFQVWPRDPVGAVDAGALVDVRLLGGEATLVSMAQGPDGSWTGAVRAPNAAGATRLQVTIDGVPLAVQPRLWWDAAPP